ncbi:MAG: ASKHA domain-containing protein [Bacilli bacterium]|nr:ASKHA domain-containing protein [Bacilli bacterium]
MKNLIIHQGKKTTILKVQIGSNLLETLRKHGFFVRANCGGNGHCGKCGLIYNGKKVLACQTIIDEDCEVRLEEPPIFEINPIEIHAHHTYRVVIDIGTTTLAAYLLDGVTHEQLASLSYLNPQISYGADVITRIHACSQGHQQSMHCLIISAINDIIRSFLGLHIPDDLIISGNTVMLHLLMNVDQILMGKAPYRPSFVDHQRLNGTSLNINANKVLLLPSISSFLGSDIVAGCLYAGLLKEMKPTLFIDLGTNGEIVLKANNRFYGASTAAGPAFEGANIEKGMGAFSGAITQVSYDKELSFINIGQEVKGICGSGLVDLIAILLGEGLIDESGLLNSNPKSHLSHCVRQQAFYLTNEVYITQKDIREFQLAKSAIISGITALLEVAQLALSDITKVYIAGGFGFYMNQSSAIRVGLIPEVLKDKLLILGNASGEGAILVAKDQSLLFQCDNIAKSIQTVDLNRMSSFKENFIRYLSFYDERKENPNDLK